MGDGEGGLEAVFGAGAGVGLMAALAVAAVGARLHLPVELVEIGGRGQFLTEVHLVESVRR